MTTARALLACSSATAPASTHSIEELTLPMPGHHNALNATAAIAVAEASASRTT